jgi:hypothetical protein
MSQQFFFAFLFLACIQAPVLIPSSALAANDFISISTTPPPETILSAKQFALWKTFRSNHPYHIQVIGLSEPQPNLHRLLLVSEPPPQVTMADFKAIDENILTRTTIASHTIGYDGWSRDIVVDLPPISDSQRRLLLEHISHYIFGTTYKASANVVLLPTSSANRHYDLDLQVPAAVLGAWLVPQLPESAQQRGHGILLLLVGILALTIYRKRLWPSIRSHLFIFFSLVSLSALFILVKIHIIRNDSAPLERPAISLSALDGTPFGTLGTILNKGLSGVFYSDRPGLVIWTFSRSRPLVDYKTDARQFCIDSDLILGAIATRNQLAVIGRERVLPTSDLSPLRVETILQLAGANTDELAQSYERTNLFAGPYDETNHLDWAPIYLSPELINTEYGSLLNITDQLLKSWSQDGQLRYHGFSYPQPPSWPFPYPLSIYAKADELTFNWNTKGAGYSITNGQYEIYALNRTGALPIDYLALNNEQLQKAEDIGYSYFAGQNDPNLVRVVQYAALYQLFRRFHVSMPEHPSDQLKKSQTLSAAALIAVDEIARLDANKLAAVKALLEERLKSPAKESERSGIEETLAQFDSILRIKSMLSEFTKLWGMPGLEGLADEIASPRAAKTLPPDVLTALLAGSSEEKAKLLQEASAQDQKLYVTRILSYNISKDQQVLRLLLRIPLEVVFRKYQKEMAQHGMGWIGTASVVVSQNIKTLRSSTGGHNLDAAISLFRQSEDVLPGEVEFVEQNGKRVVEYSSADTDKINSLVRIVGKDGNSASDSELKTALQAKLANTKDAPIPNLAQALHLTDTTRSSGARGLDIAFQSPVVDRIGFGTSLPAVDSDQQAIATALSSGSYSAVIVDRNPVSGQYFILHNGSRRIFQAPDVTSAQDAVLSCMRTINDKQPVRLFLRGFDPRQGEGFVRSTELQFDAADHQTITASIGETRMSSADLLEFVQAKYDFKNATIEELPNLADFQSDALEISVNVPSKAPSEAPLLIKIKVAFEQGMRVTRETLLALRHAIQEWLISLGNLGQQVDLLMVSSALLKDLEKVSPGAKASVSLSRQAKDLHIVNNSYFELHQTATS